MCHFLIFYHGSKIVVACVFFQGVEIDFLKVDKITRQFLVSSLQLSASLNETLILFLHTEFLLFCWRHKIINHRKIIFICGRIQEKKSPWLTHACQSDVTVGYSFLWLLIFSSSPFSFFLALAWCQTRLHETNKAGRLLLQPAFLLFCLLRKRERIGQPNFVFFSRGPWKMFLS